MCLSDLYRTREPLPGIITFPSIEGIQDVMGFRVPDTAAQRKSDSPALVCSAGLWQATEGMWRVRVFEREYCRIITGRLHVSDHHGRRWEFKAGSAFLFLRGFSGALQVVETVQIAYMVFSVPDTTALDWCTTSEGRTSLGQEHLTN